LIFKKQSTFDARSVSVKFVKDKNINKTGYSPSTPVFPVTIFPSMLHTHLHLHVALTRRTNGRSLGTFQKAKLFRKSRVIGRRAPSLKGPEWEGIDWIDTIRTGTNGRLLSARYPMFRLHKIRIIPSTAEEQ
jgi:hypothetical protein